MSEERPVTRPDQRFHEVTNGIDHLLPDYLIALNNGMKRPQLFIPDWIVRIVARLCDRLGVTPLTYGHYELLTYDDCPRKSGE